jgi:hypothetical protein
LIVTSCHILCQYNEALIQQMHTRTHVCVCVCVCACVRACVCVCVRMHVHACRLVHMHAHEHVYSRDLGPFIALTLMTVLEELSETLVSSSTLTLPITKNNCSLFICCKSTKSYTVELIHIHLCAFIYPTI